MTTEDSSWVFDSLVCFLHGPVWNAPLQTFIEEKSLIFDPNSPLNESNPEYKKIHNEYKNLVDYMLGSFMDEMQITPEQFEIACLEGKNQQQSDNNAFSFHQGLFQQIWAANDIKIFIRMMTQRNVELQLQALDLLERRQNSSSVDSENTEQLENIEKAETNLLSTTEEEITQELEKVVESELAMPKEGDLRPLKKSSKRVTIDDNEITKILTDETSPKDDRFDRLNLFFENQVSSEDIKSRQEYLRSQRDKILEIKKKARARQLNESAKRNQDSQQSTSGKGNRPTSSQAAQNALRGNTSEIVPKNNDAMQLRKTLAMRLRTEVVEKQ
ncbi:cilia- and flagella-associated protein 36 isoform X2 [Condylostylus longicornis]|uniref:cilia- and flagella-associated protein 36 isoform X2 n=1 Tax=Condylostylus longicornis TaxID=2530218 RepID=UPI00244E176B|nr:cilia- and flagella-associated protein 36 isoform X2 [Condylostylus longicornis]